MKNVRVARRYAKALMGAAQEARVVEKVAGDLETVAATLQASRELRRLVASPVFPTAKKSAVFQAVFAKRVNPHTMAFMTLMIEKQRETVLEDMIAQFQDLHDQQLGIVNVNAVAAVEFTTAQQKSLQAALERYTGKKVRLCMALDPKIKGGLVVRIGDTVLDASVRHQLEVLRERFVMGRSVPA